VKKSKDNANKQAKLSERVNVTLPPEIAQALNEYCLLVANKQGRIPPSLKQKVGRMAFSEWLQKHRTDVDIDFEKT